jgi:hypothetical protein
MLKHVLPQRDLAAAIIAREIRFRARLEQVADKDLREELIQMLFDYARDMRQHMAAEVKYERDRRHNA